MTAAATRDPIHTARARMLAAARYYQNAIREVQAAMRGLERTPDFRLTVRRQKAGRPSSESLTLAWWLHNCCLSALNDGRDEVAEWLREDARGGAAERSMRDFIETEERDLARIAKRRASKRAA